MARAPNPDDPRLTVDFGAKRKTSILEAAERKDMSASALMRQVWDAYARKAKAGSR